MKRIVTFVIAALAAAIVWFLASPLFINQTVDEGFDLVSADGQLDMQQVMALPAAKRRSMMPEIMAAAASAPDQPASEAMPAASPRLVATGSFVDADAIHRGSGRALLYALPDGRHVVRFEDFRTTNGPALVVYLAKHPMPGSASDVSGNGFIKLGDLKGNIGNQNYAVPAGTAIAEYRSVVIWCELFGVLFSPAALSSV